MKNAILKVQARALVDALRRVHHAMSDEQTRYYLCGVYMHVDGGKLVFIATNGHVLARAAIDFGEDPAASMPAPIILSAESVNAIIKHCGKRKESYYDLSFAIAPTEFLLTGPDGAIVQGKPVDGTYPDYKRVIPRDDDAKHTETIEREPFAETCAGIAALAGKVTRDGAAPMKLAFTDKLEVSATFDAISVTAAHDLKEHAAPITIGFNAVYLRDIFKSFENATLQIRMRDASSPAVIAAPEESRQRGFDVDAFAVLMPTRL